MKDEPERRAGARLGVCSWSTGAGSPEELAAFLGRVGADSVQLALDPIRTGAWSLERTRSALDGAGVALCSGMMGMRGEDYSSLGSIRRTGGVRPDEHWEANLAAAGENARLAAELGIDLVSFHAGFLPEQPGDPERAAMVDRLRQVVDAFAAQGVRVAFETGQERAETLTAVLSELHRPTAGVNFDPANMILYGMGDPVEALSALARWVRQVHVKDARATAQPGTWGEEVPAGEGEVDWRAFFDTLHDRRIDCDLMVEREAGDRREEDIRRAVELVQAELLRVKGSPA